MFRNALWLAQKELQYQWLAILFTGLVAVFFAIFAAILLDHSTSHLFGDDTTNYNRVVLDIIFVGMTPSFGTVFMSGPYLSFRTIKEDPFNKRMALLRSLPIPVSVLSLSRMLMMVITLTILSIIFYSLLTIALPKGFYHYISSTELVIFILLWFGYALALGGFNPFIEYGTNGKVLHIIPVLFIVVFATILIIFYQFLGIGVTEWRLILVKDIGWPLVIIALLAGVIGCYIWNYLLKQRLINKDYLS